MEQVITNNREIITVERETPMDYSSHRAECIIYEPQSETMGRCMISPNLSLVSKIGGVCNCPGTPGICEEYKKYLATRG
jgi:hypothetical protein